MVKKPSTKKAPKLSVTNLTIQYGNEIALKDVNLEIYENEIFGIIGPANSGKTSFLRAINRMDKMTSGMIVHGDIAFSGKNIKSWRNLYALRQ